jgi:hypothetical protein
MSTLTLLDALERPSILGPDRDAVEHEHDHEHDHAGDLPARRVAVGGAPMLDAHRHAAVGGAPTLDDLLTGAWTALTSHRAVACPMCDGEMEPRYGAGYAAVAGRCTRCETSLS